MKQNQQFRGMGLILLVMALIFFASTLTQQGSLFLSLIHILPAGAHKEIGPG